MADTTHAIAVVLPAMPKKLGINAEWISLRDTVVKEAAGIVVNSDAGFRAGCDLLQRVTKLSNQLERFRKDYTDPFLKAQRAIKAMADGAREPLERTKEALQAQLDPWAETQRKAEQAAQEESARLAQEQAESAELLGETAPQEDIIVQAAPVQARAVSESARVMDRIVWECADLDAVPRAFLMLDDRKVNEFKREHEDLVRKAVEEGNAGGPVPGIVFAVKYKTISA